MKNNSLGGLIVLNAALLVVFALLIFPAKPAQGQLGGMRSDYVMVSGRTPGQASSNTIYVTDMGRAVMLAVFYRPAGRQRGKLTSVGFRNLSQDFAERPGETPR